MVYLDPRPAELEFIPAENLPVNDPFFCQQSDCPLLERIGCVGIVFPERGVKDVCCQLPVPDGVVNRVDVVVVRMGVENHVHMRNTALSKKRRQITGVFPAVEDHRFPVAVQHIGVAVQRVERVNPEQVLVFPALGLFLVDIHISAGGRRPQHQNQHQAEYSAEPADCLPARFRSEHRKTPSAGCPGVFLYHLPDSPSSSDPRFSSSSRSCPVQMCRNVV